MFPSFFLLLDFDVKLFRLPILADFNIQLSDNRSLITSFIQEFSLKQNDTKG